MDKSVIINEIQKARKEMKFQNIGIDTIDEIGIEFAVIQDLGGKIDMTDWARSQALRMLGIPKSFYDQLGLSVQKSVIRNQRVILKERLPELKARISGDKVTAFLEPEYAEVKIEEMIEKLPDWDYKMKMINPDEPIMVLRGTHEKMKIKGDMCHGFDFVMSEVGGHDLRIEAMLFELACENGNIRSRSTGGPFFKIPMTLLQGPEFVVVAERLSTKLEAETSKLVKRLDIANKAIITNPRAEVESWLDTRIPHLVVKKVASRLETDKQEGSMTVGQLAWLVSNVAHETTNYRARVHFERWAGRMLGIGIDVAVN